MKNVEEGEKQFTASVWILSKGNPKKMLLIHHKKLNKWQQPGGHIEKHENPVDAAIREVKEETGIDISFIHKDIQVVDHESTFLPVPRFFMEQRIAARRDEPEHFHLDINYVVEIEEAEVKFNSHETHDIKWFEKHEIEALDTHGDTKVIVAALL